MNVKIPNERLVEIQPVSERQFGSACCVCHNEGLVGRSNSSSRCGDRTELFLREVGQGRGLTVCTA
jgi:hypothetical protein